MTLGLAVVSVCAAVLGLGGLACGENVGKDSGAGAAGARQAELAGVESGFVDVDGGKIFYERAGRGDAVVLVHDGTLHREVWNGQFPVFATDHLVVRYDRRGYGRSPMPDKPYSNVEDLNALFTQLKIKRATLVGMSAGGGLCIDFALKYPEKVTALVLVGAVVSGLGFTEHMYTRGGRLTMEDYGKPDVMRDYWLNQDPYLIYPGNKQARETLKQLVAANPQDLDDAKYQFMRQPERPALPNLREIAVPTIVIVGEYDIPDVHAHAGAIEAGIPGAERYVIRDAGHLVPLEQPDIFNERATLLLKRLGGGASGE